MPRPKRKDVDRYPSGRIKPPPRRKDQKQSREPMPPKEPQEDPRQEVWRRRLRQRYGVAITRALTPKEVRTLGLDLGTTFDRVKDRLTKEARWGCQVFLDAYCRYRATQGLPTKFPKAAALDQIRGGGGPEPSEEAIAEAREAWGHVDGALRACGSGVPHSMERLMVWDAPTRLRHIELGGAKIWEAMKPKKQG